METFTRDEMRKLIDFFKTPEGRKFAAGQSELTKRTPVLRAHPYVRDGDNPENALNRSSGDIILFII